MQKAKSLRSLLVLMVSVLVLIGYNVLSAQTWTNPPANPPTNNSSAPVHVGTAAQDKAGMFTAYKLGAIAPSPVVEFIDTDATQKDWRIAVEGGNNFVVRADRTDDLTSTTPINWSDDGNLQLVLFNGAANTNDYAQFSNQVRATEYCDRGGANCVSSTNIVSGSYRLNVLEAGDEGWNSFNPTTYPSIDIVSMDDYPVCFLTTNHVIAREDHDLTAAGGCVLTNDGSEWFLEAIGAKRTTTICRASCIGDGPEYRSLNGRVQIFTDVRTDGNPSIDAAQAIFSGNAERSAVCEIIFPGSVVDSFTDQAVGTSNGGTNIYATGNYNGSNWQYRLYAGGGWGGTIPITPADRFLTSITCRK